MILIDGSIGEGGGQILRSSLSLSLVTGKPFKIKKIRAGRKKPGLLRQHLTAVNAAKRIGNAYTEGNNISSQELVFKPCCITPGIFNFQVGTAGSATLVFQTIFPALIFADSPSSLILEGGTHNPYAPPFDFLASCFLPCMEKMGVKTRCSLIQHGFYPAGGGKFKVEIEPVKKLNRINLLEKGEQEKIEVIGLVSKIPQKIAESEVDIIINKMSWKKIKTQSFTVNSPGPGNIVFAKLFYNNICEVITGFGQRGVSLKKVAGNVVTRVIKYLDSGVPVGEYLADQLLIPFALSGGGSFTTLPLSDHSLTNIEIIQKFLDVRIKQTMIDKKSCLIEIKGVEHGVD